MTHFTNFGSRGGPQGGSSQETPQYYGSESLIFSDIQSVTLNIIQVTPTFSYYEKLSHNWFVKMVQFFKKCNKYENPHFCAQNGATFCLRIWQLSVDFFPVWWVQCCQKGNTSHWIFQLFRYHQSLSTQVLGVIVQCKSKQVRIQKIRKLGVLRKIYDIFSGNTVVL